MNPRVFITNDRGEDFDKACEYGELVRITIGPANVFNPDRIARDVKRALASFRHDADYLLLAGATMVSAISLLELGHFRKLPAVRLVILDAKSRKYVTRTLNLL